MRLAVVVNRFPTLSEPFIFNKVLGLQQVGVDVTVWVHSRGNDASSFDDRLTQIRPGCIKFTLLADGVAVLPFALAHQALSHPIRSLGLLMQAIVLFPDLRRSMRAWAMALPLALGNYDLIHFEFSGLAVSYLDALPLLHSAKLLASCRGAAEQITPLVHPERIRLLAETFTQLDSVHCVSSDLQHTCIGFGLRPERSFINHPAIDPNAFQRRKPYQLKSDGPYRLISVSRLHWKKGLDFAALAIKRLVEAGIDVEYYILGGGEEEEKLRFLIHQLGLENRLKLLGKQPASTVRAALEESDIFLLPSLSEGLSNAVLEAMAMEIPVISTTVGGMAEAITDGQEGFLVPPMQPDIMAAKIKLLLDQPNLRAQMGQAGRIRVNHQFPLHRQINGFVEQYNKLAQSNVHG